MRPELAVNTFGPQPQARVPWWALLIAPVMMLLTLGVGLLTAVALESVFAGLDGLLVPIVAVGVTVASGVACGVFFDRLAERDRARNLHPRCPRCDYDLRYLPEPRCPECGQNWKVQPSTAPARHDRGAARLCEPPLNSGTRPETPPRSRC